MKFYWYSYAITTILFSILLGIIMWFFYPFLNKGKVIARSPLPSFLTLAYNKQVRSLDLWLPSVDSVYDIGIKKPDITAKSALLYDLTENKILYAKKIHDKLPMASLTKIMTAIVAMENRKYDDKYVVNKQSLVGENSMGLSEHEMLSFDDLLYGLVLPSGNDAAEVLAQNSLGRREFITAMNNKVQALALLNTHFTNPSGLEGDGDQHTTVYDLLVMTRYALVHFPLFDEVAQTFEYAIPQTATHKDYYLQNETNLLTSYPGVKGVKDGYTPEAGLCLVTYLDYDGHKIIGVILGSDNRRGEMIELLDYSLKTLGLTPPRHS